MFGANLFTVSVFRVSLTDLYRLYLSLGKRVKFC